MQQIERYGVIALVFLLVTIVAVSFWGDSKSPGFWSRLTGRGAKKDVAASQVQPSPETAPQSTEATPALAAQTPVQTSAPVATPAATPAATGERALATELPLSAASETSNRPAPAAAPTADLGAQSAPQFARNEPKSMPMAAPTAAPMAKRAQPSSTPAPRAPLTAAAAMPAAVPSAGSSEYTVQKGDSLMRIAARTLGSKERWTEIRDLNHGVDPHGLRVGMKLVIPASASKSSADAKHVVPVKKPATAPASKKETTGSTTDTYLVHKGDTLKSIAEHRLGDSARWKEIAAANPKMDPNRLIVGAQIKVPKAKSGGHLESKSEPALAAAMPHEMGHATSADRPHVR